MRAVSAIYFHWVFDSAIERPAKDVQFDCLTGISSCYQYFMLREAEVLMRPYSCWCPALRSRGLASTLSSAAISTYLTAPMPATLFTRGAIRAVGPRQMLKLAPQTRGLEIAGTRSRLQAYRRVSGCLSMPSVTMTTRCGSGRPWSSLISVANLATGCIRRDRNVYVMRFNAGISWSAMALAPSM